MSYVAIDHCYSDIALASINCAATVQSLCAVASEMTRVPPGLHSTNGYGAVI